MPSISGAIIISRKLDLISIFMFKAKLLASLHILQGTESANLFLKVYMSAVVLAVGLGYFSANQELLAAKCFLKRAFSS